MVKKNDFLTKQGARFLWLLPKNNQEQSLSLAASYGLSFPLMEALIGRGFSTKTLLDAYLFSVYDEKKVHPSHFADARKAVERIRKAVDAGEKILIFGDYDVDGMSSTALVLFCLLKIGAAVNFYLPQRSIDGYGLSASAVRKAAHNGFRLIITVDNGITAFSAANAALECGIDLIITDHHHPHDQLPPAYAIINPLRADCCYPFKVLAGVGVAFKLMMLLYEELNLRLPEKVYELLALGTIADVVPLIDENRYWVRQGLATINRSRSLPLTILKQQSKIEREELSSLDIGFSIAPQLNALGRLSDPRKAIGFLIGDNIAMVHEVGQTLYELNETRKETERSIYRDIEAAIIDKRIDLEKEKIIIAAHRSWQSGVIGLVAARLVAAYGRPALLFHCTADGMATGSGRSIPAFNLFNALEASHDLLEHFGGHSVAAGLSLKVEQLPRLKERLEKLIDEQLTPYDLQQKIRIDASLVMTELTTKLMTDLKLLEPFGRDNEQPLFYIRKVCQLQKPQLLKDQHVKALIFADGVIKPIIFFNRPDLFPWLLDHGSEPFDCAAYVVENNWQGRTQIELQGVDVARTESGEGDANL